MKTPINRHAAAWAFVLQYRDLVDRMTYRLGIETRLPLDDYRSEVIADLVATFDRFDAKRGSPSTWIWMRAAKVRRGMVREAIRNTSDVDVGRHVNDVDAEERGGDVLDFIEIGGVRRNAYGPERIVAAAELVVLARRRPHVRDQIERAVNG